MSDIKQHMDTNSAAFRQGEETGLNSTEETKNWRAGDELGRELKDEVDDKEQVSERVFKEISPPLFTGDRSDGKEANLQDEKDETEE